MSEKNRDKYVTVRVNDEEDGRLDEGAYEDGTDRSKVVRKALRWMYLLTHPEKVDDQTFQKFAPYVRRYLDNDQPGYMRWGILLASVAVVTVLVIVLRVLHVF